MDALTRLITASVDVLILGVAIVVIFLALYVFARSIAEGQGAIAGFKKMWSVLWNNMP